MGVRSPFCHKEHPALCQVIWKRIFNEKKVKGGKREHDLETRKRIVLQILQKQMERDETVRTLVFANTPETCLAMEMMLKGEKIKCGPLHSAVGLPDRIEALKQFVKGDINVLVCTDLAARGLDLPVCRQIIQLEFAKNAIEYVHRVGRAARAGRKSRVYNLWGPYDKAVKEAVIEAPDMGLDGNLLERKGNRHRLTRIRRKMRKAENAYSDVRKMAREGKKRAPAQTLSKEEAERYKEISAEVAAKSKDKKLDAKAAIERIEASLSKLAEMDGGDADDDVQGDPEFSGFMLTGSTGGGEMSGGEITVDLDDVYVEEPRVIADEDDDDGDERSLWGDGDNDPAEAEED